VNFAVSTSEIKNGDYTLLVRAIDSNGHSSDVAQYSVSLHDPGLKLSLPTSPQIVLPNSNFGLNNSNNQTSRSIKSASWSVNGKSVGSTSTGRFPANFTSFVPGSNKVSVQVVDSLGQSQSFSRSYLVKFSPAITIPELDTYDWYIPATPSFKVYVTLAKKNWTGTGFISYVGANGPSKLTFKASNGIANVTLGTLKRSTQITVTIPGTKTTEAATISKTVALQIRPPTPVHTTITVTAPSTTYWPSLIPVTVTVSGQGLYQCHERYQDGYYDFNVNAGHSTSFKIQPSYGINLTENLSVYCDGGPGTVRTYAQTSISMATR
jgi:hypothetical protein